MFIAFETERELQEWLDKYTTALRHNCIPEERRLLIQACVRDFARWRARQDTGAPNPNPGDPDE